MLEGVGADVDLYARIGALPEKGIYTDRSVSPDGTEALVLGGGGQTIFVAVTSVNGPASFRIRAVRARSSEIHTLHAGLSFMPVAGDMTTLRSMIEGAERVFFGATEGQIIVDTVNLHNPVFLPWPSGCDCGGYHCDICINNTSGRANYNGLTDSVNLFREDWGDPRVLAHEWGHDILGLPDEYHDHNDSSGNVCHSDDQCGHTSMSSLASRNLCTSLDHRTDTQPAGHICSVGAGCNIFCGCAGNGATCSSTCVVSDERGRRLERARRPDLVLAKRHPRQLGLPRRHRALSMARRQHLVADRSPIMKSQLLVILSVISIGATAVATVPTAQPRIALLSPEMSSGLPSDVQVVIELLDYSAARLEQLSGQLAKGVELRRTKDGTRIAVEVALTAEDPPRLVIKPARALVAGDYEVRLRAPELVGAFPSGRLTRRSDGTVGLGLHVGAAPMVERVELCPSPTSKRERLRIIYSEPVRLEQKALLADAVLWSNDRGEVATCVDAAELVPEMVTTRLANGEATHVWELECEPLDGDGFLSIGKGVVGGPPQAGAPLGRGAGFEAVLIRAELQAREACLVFVP